MSATYVYRGRNKRDEPRSSSGPESPESKDKQAEDVVALLQLLAAWTLIPPRRPGLETCTQCGAIERADRACQVCLARRRAAS